MDTVTACYRLDMKYDREGREITGLQLRWGNFWSVVKKQWPNI